ncbi:OLC1v1030557C1 [Oldenlandia corymbosa var. corymbosa]|uniref:OLC1v1030557C1 n=1 Tax=Oldenlandia corymbosa var. corymbosa TaxID=529605 RepID=A0AAV1CG97_OLDCO|nr:OLC1v1030557C1 [Oldenlandia corymbosa var. corymbosa]
MQGIFRYINWEWKKFESDDNWEGGHPAKEKGAGRVNGGGLDIPAIVQLANQAPNNNVAGVGGSAKVGGLHAIANGVRAERVNETAN